MPPCAALATSQSPIIEICAAHGKAYVNLSTGERVDEKDLPAEQSTVKKSCPYCMAQAQGAVLPAYHFKALSYSTPNIAFIAYDERLIKHIASKPYEARGPPALI